ncbi:hypothetical protein [Natrinema sp. 1APR25-10V2]|uniref:hypothetical protein n=1 Tax=Natrinema sp. 1APR25-10V2 TaxID=2951081 RepID=UPI002875F317|nr:hypothetical protein [Natrinema sp. 1APR25-10V2]MDS0475849.1 hypothetical protein [Natrinema sp. 1APR25-10V2]
MQDVATSAVSCPYCSESATVSLPGSGTDVKVRRSIAAFGEHTTVTCSEGHTYWVYFC